MLMWVSIITYFVIGLTIILMQIQEQEIKVDYMVVIMVPILSICWMPIMIGRLIFAYIWR